MTDGAIDRPRILTVHSYALLDNSIPPTPVYEYNCI